MAHIQRRGPHRWRARYVDPKGREHSRTFSRKADAEKFLVSVEGSKLNGEWVDPALGKTTFGEWAAQWMKTTVHHKPRTRAGNESLLRCHILPVFGDTQLSRITPVHMRDWVADRSTVISPGRLRQAHWLLSNILKTAVEAGYIARSPCIGIRLPRVQRHEMRFLTAEQVRRLADAIDPRYETLVLLLAYCGLRWGEACALRRGRCEFARSRLEVRASLADVSGKLHFGPTKTYQTRWVVMPPFVRQRLEELFAAVPGTDDDLVFTAPSGGPLRSEWRRRFWKPAVRAAGLPEELRVHDLRHTCAALLIRQGAHPKAIQAHLGHSTITVTMDLYGHLFPDDADRLAEALETAYQAATAAAAQEDLGETPT